MTDIQKTLLTIAGVLAGLLLLLGVIWYYGNTRYESGKSDVYLEIAQGKYDRNFTYYVTLPAPKPIIRIIPGTGTGVDSTALDSLQNALKDSGAVIQRLAEGWKGTIGDSTTYTQDSLSVTFRGIHNFIVDPIRKILSDTFTAGDIQFPVKVEQKVILRDPTFWDNLEMILYGTGIGVVIMVIIGIVT